MSHSIHLLDAETPRSCWCQLQHAPSDMCARTLAASNHDYLCVIIVDKKSLCWLAVGETDANWSGTLDLVGHYRFAHTHISQFYPR